MTLVSMLKADWERRAAGAVTTDVDEHAAVTLAGCDRFF
jgi:hypothetical protein